ncbi:MAG: hypothetical protein ACR2I5_07940 [Candidatus Limnocylindria bacterium]
MDHIRIAGSIAWAILTRTEAVDLWATIGRCAVLLGWRATDQIVDDFSPE